MLRVCVQMGRILVHNSYADPPFPKSCIRPCTPRSSLQTEPSVSSLAGLYTVLLPVNAVCSVPGDLGVIFILIRDSLCLDSWNPIVGGRRRWAVGA